MKNTNSVHKIVNAAMLITIATSFISSTASAQGQSAPSACGPLRSAGQYGPYDSRSERDKLPIVLNAHFTPEVEALARGLTGSVGVEIDYTLRAIPNYHRALIAMMRLGEKEKTPQPRGSRYSVECWFIRAIQFVPDDSIVRMIYSTYLKQQGRVVEATSQLDIATTFAKDNPFTHYNLGLHYFDLMNYDKALLQAHEAIALGFPQTALRDQLQTVGKWTDPAPAPATAPSAAISLPASEIK